jgi:hypothetical protein
VKAAKEVSAQTPRLGVLVDDYHRWQAHVREAERIAEIADLYPL